MEKLGVFFFLVFLLAFSECKFHLKSHKHKNKLSQSGLTSSSTWYDGSNFSLNGVSFNSNCPLLASYIGYFKSYNNVLDSYSSAQYTASNKYLNHIKNKISGILVVGTSVSYSDISAQRDIVCAISGNSQYYDDVITFVKNYQENPNNDWSEAYASVDVAFTSLMNILGNFADNVNSYSASISSKLTSLKSTAFDFQTCADKNICNYNSGVCGRHDFVLTSGNDYMSENESNSELTWGVTSNQDDLSAQFQIRKGTTIYCLFSQKAAQYASIYNLANNQVRFTKNSCANNDASISFEAVYVDSVWKWKLKSKNLNKYFRNAVVSSTKKVKADATEEVDIAYYTPLLV